MDNDLIKFLITNGYKEYPSMKYSKEENESRLFCKSVNTKFHCFCNNKSVQICVNYHDFILPDTAIIGMLDIGITACSNADLWYQLKCYSITPNDLINNLVKLERDVIRAWEAVNEKIV